MVKAAHLEDATKRLEKLAGEEEESPDNKMLNARIPKDLIKRVKHYCTDKEILIQDYVAEALEKDLEASGY